MEQCILIESPTNSKSFIAIAKRVRYFPPETLVMVDTFRCSDGKFHVLFVNQHLQTNLIVHLHADTTAEFVWKVVDRMKVF